MEERASMRRLHMENLVVREDDLKSEAGIKTLFYPRALLILTSFNITIDF
jgi:hypothetical protein